ncbi:hypothetical protein OG909_22480 [Streptomyces sp. NBC_01754]|uniref:hypothetical protein n=1 Tax=Streptomyces sp. NBC_01754 TaxID=2975930 RepID=UPI002DDC4610|nr:hypothetical protein [Streptomyces sp. NBC_01754]WSC94820.1 hypothetical protein OG909_22480 [Streptomyces sp. NBC_01754]
MIAENTKEGVAAAEAAGKTMGRPAAFDEDQAADVVEAYVKGAAAKALARQYCVAPKAIRRVLDTAGARDIGDVLEEPGGVPADVEDQEQAAAQPHAIDVPGLLAEHLNATDVAEIREALSGGRTICRGQGHSVRVTAPLALHQAVLKQCAALAGDGSARAGARRTTPTPIGSPRRRGSDCGGPCSRRWQRRGHPPCGERSSAGIRLHRDPGRRRRRRA